jgi:DNA excision repair protein ERCC-4
VVSDASSKRINDDKDRLPETRKKRRVSESEGVTTKPAMGQHDVDVEDDIDDDPSMLHASLLDPSLNITLLTHSQCVDEYCPLWDLTPSYIVLVDPEVSIIRLIETYQADLCSRQEARAPTKVYFLMYQDSIEEHRYSVSLQREKKSFEDLIQKKSHMVVTLPEIPGGRAEMRSSSSDREYALDSRTRRSGAGSSGSSVSSTSRVVVDIREFGSSLPSLLHLHHIEIFPVTLLVRIVVSCQPLLLSCKICNRVPLIFLLGLPVFC